MTGQIPMMLYMNIPTRVIIFWSRNNYLMLIDVQKFDIYH